MPQPKLVLLPYRYKSGVAFSVIPQDGSGDWDVDRNSPAYRMNENGVLVQEPVDIMRLDWFDPTTGGIASCPSVLVESTATNSYWPSAINGAGWTPSGLTVLGNIATETATNAVHRMEGTGRAASAGVLGCYSFIVRKNGALSRTISMQASNNSDGAVMSGIFSLQTGNRVTAASSSGSSWSNIGSGLIRLPNSRYLIYVYGQSAAGSSHSIRIDPRDINGNQTYLGDVSMSFELTHVKMELGNFPTSPTDTVSAAATRNADVITVTVPSGVTQIITTFADNTTDIELTIPSTFTLPVGRIKSVVMI